MDADSMASALAGGVALLLLAVSLWFYGGTARRMFSVGGGRFDVRVFGRGDLLLAVLLVAWFLLNVLVAAGLGGGSPVGRGEILVGTLFQLGLVGMVIVFLYFRKRPVARLFGLGRMKLPGVLLAAVGLLLAAYPLILVSAHAGGLLFEEEMAPQAIVEFFVSGRDAWDRFLVIFLAVAVAPVCEEILFRGYLYGVFKKYQGWIPGMLAVAVLFSLVHLHAPSLLVFFTLSLCLTLAFELTGSLLVPMAMHALFNAVSISALILFPEVVV